MKIIKRQSGGIVYTPYISPAMSPNNQPTLPIPEFHSVNPDHVVIPFTTSVSQATPINMNKTTPTNSSVNLSEETISSTKSASQTPVKSTKISKNASKNTDAWNEIWNKFGHLLGLKDEVAYLHLLGQLQHESGGFKYMEEIASGKAYEGRKSLGNTKPGDGVRYKGRGPIQVTGRANYTKIYKEFFVPNGLGEYNIVDHPELGSDPRIGSLMSMGWLLVTENGKNTISALNRHDVKAVTRYINGGYNGLEDRIKRVNKLLKEYGYA